MTEKRFRVTIGNENSVSFIDTQQNKRFLYIKFHTEKDAIDCKNALMYQCSLLNELHEENQALKSDLAKIIEQSRKNNELCVSDIRILEKALWCTGCENDYDRLRQLRKEFLK